jgi:hypothetical protein
LIDDGEIGFLVFFKESLEEEQKRDFTGFVGLLVEDF